MKNLLFFLFILYFCAACHVTSKKEEAVQYPETKKVDQTDNYFGTAVADPYRWLEDDRAEDTEAWVEAQNEVTFGYLNNIPFRDALRDRFTELWNYPRYSAPVKEGENYFFYKNDGLQNQAVLYIQKSLTDTPEVFIDPNTFSEDGTVALSDVSISKDGKYAAYAVARSGSDWQEIKVKEVTTRQEMEDTLQWIKFSGMAWFGDGFFYSRYDAPEEGTDAYTSKNEYHKVYYHRLGQPQAQDELIFEDQEHSLRNLYASTTEDERFLVISASEGTSGNTLMIKDLQNPESEFITVIDNFDHDHNLIGNIGDTLFIHTNLDAPNWRLVSVNFNNPSPENWETLVPEKESLLESVSLASGKLFLRYLEDAYSKVYEYAVDGNQEKEIKLPGIGSVAGFEGKASDTELFYQFTSFTHPSVIYKYDISTGESTVFRESEIAFDMENYETRQVFYESKDGTRVPMFVVHKKGLTLDGNNPTLLYSYGGFNINMTPGFRVTILPWLEQGGIYAQPSLRGGGEYGEKWHKAGMKENKQNVFDDFIAAAEYLVAENYTRPEKLAIFGGSNGGLLVGACMTQRPDLFQVALPAVGVMDMLRYHQFTIGWAWAVEYGSSEDSTHFHNLYRYSPLHNIKEGVEYPATLITTADHDDRVVPAHSFKFAATLQEKHEGDNPVLIRIETKAGHGAGKPISKVIDEYTDIFAFTWYNMDFVPDYGR